MRAKILILGIALIFIVSCKKIIGEKPITSFDDDRFLGMKFYLCYTESELEYLKSSGKTYLLDESWINFKKINDTLYEKQSYKNGRIRFLKYIKKQDTLHNNVSKYYFQSDSLVSEGTGDIARSNAFYKPRL